MVNFPIDLKQYKKLRQSLFSGSFAYLAHRLKLDPANPQLTAEQSQILKHNIQLLRDVIVLFTSTGAARGVSGHTGQYICFIGLSMGQISILILAEIYPRTCPLPLHTN